MESRCFVPDEFLNGQLRNNDCFAKFWGRLSRQPYSERREAIAVKHPAQLRLKSEER
jgi:hypothetical protein